LGEKSESHACALLYAVEKSRPQVSLIGADSILEDSQRRIEKYGRRSAGVMLRIAVAPFSLFSVSNDLMRVTAAIARYKERKLDTYLVEKLEKESNCQEGIGGMRPRADMES